MEPITGTQLRDLLYAEMKRLAELNERLVKNPDDDATLCIAHEVRENALAIGTLAERAAAVGWAE